MQHPFMAFIVNFVSITLKEKQGAVGTYPVDAREVTQTSSINMTG